MRRQLRAGQPAPHQRPVRLPPLARAGARDRRADPVGRDRLAAISRRPIRRRCSRNAATIASWSPVASQMPRVAGDRDPRGGRQARRVGGGDPGRRRAAAGRPMRRRPRSAGLLPPRAGRHAGASRSRPPCRAAERRRPRHDPVRLGLPGRARRASGARRAPQGADGARAARQGACRMGQSLRRRHDRADRLLVRLLRDARLRRPADARHRLSLSAILSARAAASASRRSISAAENIGRRAAGRSRRRRRRAGDARGAAAAARAESATARISRRRASITPRRARRSTIWPSARRASG